MLIERAFVISLKIRPDRLGDFLGRAAKVWPASLPEIELWPAVHGDTCQPPDNWVSGNGAWGCLRSHQSILEYCLNNGIGSYMVFEDDAQFAGWFADAVAPAFAALPDDWQQFYLGGQLVHEHSHPPVRINDLIYRPFNVNRTHCFAVSRDGMLPMYRWICNLPYHGTEHIDHHLGRLHESGTFATYCPGQWMVGQGGTSSNISGNTDPITFYRNPEEAALSHWLYDRPLCFVLRGPRWIAQKLEHRFHYGNARDNAGYDKGLALATKFRYPGPEITRWFGYVRSECVREGGYRVPCLYHPGITDDMISGASVGRVFVIEPTSTEHAQQQLDAVLNEWLSQTVHPGARPKHPGPPSMPGVAAPA